MPLSTRIKLMREREREREREKKLLGRDWRDMEGSERDMSE